MEKTTAQQSLETVIKALELVQKKGAFTLQDSALIVVATENLKAELLPKATSEPKPQEKSND